MCKSHAGMIPFTPIKSVLAPTESNKNAHQHEEPGHQLTKIAFKVGLPEPMHNRLCSLGLCNVHRTRMVPSCCLKNKKHVIQDSTRPAPPTSQLLDAYQDAGRSDAKGAAKGHELLQRQRHAPQRINGDLSEPAAVRERKS